MRALYHLLISGILGNNKLVRKLAMSEVVLGLMAKRSGLDEKSANILLQNISQRRRLAGELAEDSTRIAAGAVFMMFVALHNRDTAQVLKTGRSMIKKAHAPAIAYALMAHAFIIDADYSSALKIAKDGQLRSGALAELHYCAALANWQLGFTDQTTIEIETALRLDSSHDGAKELKKFINKKYALRRAAPHLLPPLPKLQMQNLD